MHKLIPFTKTGYEELIQKLEIYHEKRPNAVKTLSRAREMGDLSENGLYRAAKFELSDIDRQIRFFKNLLKYAKVFVPINNQTVQIGHKVTISSTDGSKTYYIVGEYEANPKLNKISYKSPFGISILNKKRDDSFIVKTPSGTKTYLITDISL